MGLPRWHPTHGLSKGQLRNVFRTLATDTKPRRRLVAATECLLHVSIRRSSNSSLARVKYPRLDVLEICTWPWRIEFYYVL